MIIKKMRLSELVSPDYNPRVNIHDDPELYTSLYNSITRLGYIDPIIVNVKDGKNTIVGGNQRYTVICDMAEDAGVKTNQVELDIVAVEFDEDVEIAANIGLNNIHGDFVADKLKEDLKLIEGMNKELFSITGFDEDFIEKTLRPLEKELKEQTVPDFKLMIKLPPEYESLYNMYSVANGKDAMNKEIMKILAGGKK